MSGLCPSCRKPLAQATRVAPMKFGTDGEITLNAFAILCAHCEVVVGVLPDPAIIARAVTHRLAQGEREEKNGVVFG